MERPSCILASNSNLTGSPSAANTVARSVFDMLLKIDGLDFPTFGIITQH